MCWTSRGVDIQDAVRTASEQVGQAPLARNDPSRVAIMPGKLGADVDAYC